MGVLIGNHGNKVITAWHNTLLRDHLGQLAYEAETVCVSTPPPQRCRIQADVEFADPKSDVAVLDLGEDAGSLLTNLPPAELSDDPDIEGYEVDLCTLKGNWFTGYVTDAPPRSSSFFVALDREIRTQSMRKAPKRWARSIPVGLRQHWIAQAKRGLGDCSMGWPSRECG
jgi:hypothetical protein